MFVPKTFLRCFLLCASVASFAEAKQQSKESPIDEEQHRELIINGVYADYYRYPYFAMMTNTYDGSRCGGALISRRFVLTAAHCTYEPETFEIFHGGSRYEYEVKRSVSHSLFNQTEHWNHDIALYELAEDVPADVPYVHLSTARIEENFLAYNMGNPLGPLTVMGMGNTYPHGNDFGTDEENWYPPDHLLETNINYVPDAFCQDWVKSTDNGDHGDWWKVNPDTMICAYGTETGMCDGDSGGPLILKGDQFKPDYLVGLVSWHFKCYEYMPDMYVRLSYYYEWIASNMCFMNPYAVPYYVNCFGGNTKAARSVGQEGGMPDPLVMSEMGWP